MVFSANPNKTRQNADCAVTTNQNNGARSERGIAPNLPSALPVIIATIATKPKLADKTNILVVIAKERSLVECVSSAVSKADKNTVMATKTGSGLIPRFVLKLLPNVELIGGYAVGSIDWLGCD
jgi:hypothetical protein